MWKPDRCGQFTSGRENGFTDTSTCLEQVAEQDRRDSGPHSPLGFILTDPLKVLLNNIPHQTVDFALMNLQHTWNGCSGCGPTGHLDGATCRRSVISLTKVLEVRSLRYLD